VTRLSSQTRSLRTFTKKDDGFTSIGRACPSQPPMAPPNAPPPEAVDLVEYLNEAWTPYHAVLASCKRLMAAGFEASPRARPSFRLSRSRTTFLFLRIRRLAACARRQRATGSSGRRAWDSDAATTATSRDFGRPAWNTHLRLR
jgi:hypothetical protein